MRRGGMPSSRHSAAFGALKRSIGLHIGIKAHAVPCGRISTSPHVRWHTCVLGAAAYRYVPRCRQCHSPTVLWRSAPCLSMQVMSLLGWTKPGPQLGKVMAAVMDWQLMNPSGTAEQAEEMVRQKFGSGAQ